MPNDPSIRLPPPFGILDHDLIYITTGYNQNNCQLISRELSIKDLREYILVSDAIRDGNHIYIDKLTGSGIVIHSTGLNTNTENLIVKNTESIFPYSGSIYTTGLNAITGNNIEIQFSTETPASEKYGKTGGKYRSGIISTTGLNSRTENLMVRDFENSWPYSGIIYNTGLNAIIGNNIEIQFSSGTPASDKFGGIGYKYRSGIISTTGLNSRSENLIVRDFENSWPYSGIIYNTGLNAKAGNNIEITYSIGSSADSIYGGAGDKYRSGIISTTGLNATPGSGIYFIQSAIWPFSQEIHSLEKYYEVNSNYDLYTNSNIVDLSFPIPISISTGINIKQLNSYSKIKIDGYYSRITFNTHLPIPQPTRSNVGWSHYNLISLKQGCAILGMLQATRYVPSWGGGIANTTSPLYDYSQEFSELQPRPTTDLYGRGGAILCSNHVAPGSTSSIDMYNCHFLAFYNIPEIVTYPYQDIVGVVGVLNNNNFNQILPSCTVQWFGTEYGTGAAVTEIASVNGYINSIIAYGHRFVEVKPV